MVVDGLARVRSSSWSLLFALDSPNETHNRSPSRHFNAQRVFVTSSHPATGRRSSRRFAMPTARCCSVDMSEFGYVATYLHLVLSKVVICFLLWVRT